MRCWSPSAGTAALGAQGEALEEEGWGSDLFMDSRVADPKAPQAPVQALLEHREGHRRPRSEARLLRRQAAQGAGGIHAFLSMLLSDSATVQQHALRIPNLFRGAALGMEGCPQAPNPPQKKQNQRYKAPAVSWGHAQTDAKCLLSDYLKDDC